MLRSGHYLLSASADETVRLWNAASGQCEKVYKGHQGQVLGLSPSPDESHFLSAGEDGVLKLWNIKKTKAIRTFKGHSGQVFSVCYSLDGEYALSASSDGTLIFWSVKNGRPLQVFKGHTGFVRSGSLSGDNRYAISGGDDHTVRVWDVDTGQCLRVFSGHVKPVHAATFSQSSRFAVSGGGDHTLKLWMMDWEYQQQKPAEWDKGVVPLLKPFLRRRNKGLNPQQLPLSTRIIIALFGSKKGPLNEKELEEVARILGLGGFGWLKPDTVRVVLDGMESGLLRNIHLPKLGKTAATAEPPLEAEPVALESVAATTKEESVSLGVEKK